MENKGTPSGTCQIQGQPTRVVVAVHRNAAGKAQHLVVNHRPRSSVLLFARAMGEKYAGTPLGKYFISSDFGASACTCSPASSTACSGVTRESNVCSKTGGSFHEIPCTAKYPTPGRGTEKGNCFSTESARGIMSTSSKLGNLRLR